MSRRGSEGGRKKSLLDPRRHVKCPVSECKYSGRTDHVKRHFRNLIVWSKTYEGEAAEESENGSSKFRLGTTCQYENMSFFTSTLN